MIYKNVVDLTKEEVDRVVENNKKLQNEIADWLYEDNMRNQVEMADLLLNNPDNQKNYSIHDYYNSFYLRIKEPYKFLSNIDLKEVNEYCGLGDDFVEEIKKTIADYENSEDGYSENGIDLYAELDEMATKVLKKIEDNLHGFENYPTLDDIKEMFYVNIDGYTDAWIDKDYKMYRHIEYEKCYA